MKNDQLYHFLEICLFRAEKRQLKLRSPTLYAISLITLTGSVLTVLKCSFLPL